MRSVTLARLGPRIEITGRPYVANIGDTYSFTFGVSGAVGAVTWSCTPNPIGTSGLSFSAGTISGTCAAGGSFSITVTVIDALRNRATGNYVLTIVGDRVGLRIEHGSPAPALYTESRSRMYAE